MYVTVRRLKLDVITLKNYLLDFFPFQMQQALQTRLAAAEELRKAAEQERLEKEESAQSALDAEEAIMEKVVQESKMLEQEAEENSRVATYFSDSPWFSSSCKKNDL